MSDVSDRILQVMNGRGVSYGALSEATGYPKSVLQRYATGRTEKIPYDRLEKIAAALHTSVGYLTGQFERNLSALDVNVEVIEDGVRLSDALGGAEIVYSQSEWQNILDKSDLPKVLEDLNTEENKIKARDAEDELKAAFFSGYADDLSKEEIDKLWNDAKNFFEFMIKKRKEDSDK